MLSVASITKAVAVLGLLATHSALASQDRRIPLDSIRALTFYKDELTTARRTAPVPQLTCEGRYCRYYEPHAVQCTSTGNWQWRCEADLPEWLQLGRVEVSCEGWDRADDPTVLSGSCGLTYKLLERKQGQHYSRSHSSGGGGDWFAWIFWAIFFGVVFFILRSWILSLLPAGTQTPLGTGTGPRGGGGGGGGGWWPGGGGGGGQGHHPPPPPYSKQGPDTTSSTSQPSSGWRPGFWSGLAAGVAADRVFGGGGSSSAHRTRDDRDFGGGGGGFGGFGGGTTGRRFGGGDDDGGGSGSLRRSTGYGGTRNR